MQEKLLIELENIGNDISEFINRFGGMEALCLKLIKKFPTDTNYQKYMEIADRGAYEEAEESIHTLKGVSSNLGLTTILKVSQEILYALREGDLSNIEELNHRLKQAYEANIEIFERYL